MDIKGHCKGCLLVKYAEELEKQLFNLTKKIAKRKLNKEIEESKQYSKRIVYIRKHRLYL